MTIATRKTRWGVGNKKQNKSMSRRALFQAAASTGYAFGAIATLLCMTVEFMQGRYHAPPWQKFLYTSAGVGLALAWPVTLPLWEYMSQYN